VRVASLRHCSTVARSTRVTLNLRATFSAASLAQAMLAPDTSGARLDFPAAQVSPARCQPIVPLRNATTLFGMPALISDWAPMMLRVRLAQLTTIVVSGEG